MKKIKNRIFAIDFLNHYGSRYENGVDVNDESLCLLDRLFDKLSILENNSNDEDTFFYKLSFDLKRGSINENVNYRKEKYYIDERNYKEFKKNWLSYYAKENYWFDLTCQKTEYNGILYYIISVNNNYLLHVKHDPQVESYKYDKKEILEKTIYIVDKVLKQIKNDTYEKYLIKNYPLVKRNGTIKLRDFFEINPDAKANFFNAIKQYNLEDIIYYLDNDNQINKVTHFKTMTAQKYYDLCKLGYHALGKDKNCNFNNKELFIRLSDGRNNDLEKINDNDEKEFEEWYEKNKMGFDHTFEILPGHSFYRGDFRISKDKDGYYFTLNGSNWFTSLEIITFYMELRKIGIIPLLWDAELINNRFKEEGDIAVISEDKFNYGYFTVNHKTYIDAIQIEEDEMNLYKNKIEWEKLDFPHLKSV